MADSGDGHTIRNGRYRAGEEASTLNEATEFTHNGEPVIVHGPPMHQNRFVRGTHNTATVSQYLHLMQQGQKIGAGLKGGIHGAVTKGFETYSARLKNNPNYDPRKDRAATKAAKTAFMESQQAGGYKGGNAPDLLSANTKLVKNETGPNPEATAGLNLAPARLSNIGKGTTCAKATTECEASCLGTTAGLNANLSAINSKISKNHFFVQHPEHAAHLVHSELLRHIDDVAEVNAERKANGDAPMDAGARFNVVSDYHMTKHMAGIVDHVTRYAAAKGVKFVARDYTKHDERLLKPEPGRPSNYHMALSHTGTGHDESNDGAVSRALEGGHTVAAVIHGDATHFYDHRTGRHYPIVDGDSDDFIERRHAEVGHTVDRDENGLQIGRNAAGQKEGVVSALRVKGSSNAAKEAAGDFVSPTTTLNGRRVIEINKHLAV